MKSDFFYQLTAKWKSYFLKALEEVRNSFLKFHPRHNKLHQYILVGGLVRLVLAPLTGHYFDMTIFLNVAYSVGQGGLLYAPQGTLLDGAPPFYWDSHGTGYPPPWSLWLGIAYKLGGWNFYVLTLIMKIPIIIADIALIYLLFFVLKERVDDKLALNSAKLYALLPPAIFIGSVWGMFDSLTILLVLISLLYLIKNDLWKSATSLALSSALKVLPIFAFPIFLVSLFFSKGMRKSVEYIIMFVSMLLVFSVLPFFIFPGWFSVIDRMTAGLIYSYSENVTGQGTLSYSVVGIIQIITGTNITYFPIVFIVTSICYLYWYQIQRKHKPSVINLNEIVTALLLVFSIMLLTMSYPSVQHFILLFPLMLLDTALHSSKNKRFFFHMTWFWWFLWGLLHQNPPRFFGWAFPDTFGSIHDVHLRWWGDPYSRILTEQLFYSFTHNPLTAWILPTMLFLLLNSLVAYTFLIHKQLILFRRKETVEGEYS